LTKIIQFPHDKIERLIIPISPRIIKALIVACSKESQGLSFRRCDLEKAFVPLYKNGLIAVKITRENKKIKLVWYVTYLGKTTLRACGTRKVS
jgi:hypothetical protein